MRNEKGQFVKGSSGFTGKHGESSRGKIRAARARQGSNVWNKGTHLSGMRGKKHSAVTIQKMMASQRGPKNHQWAGGITPLRIQINGSYKYRQWRSDIFTRDDFTCLICRCRGGYLEVDHFPKTFSEILRGNKITNLESADNCSELWDLNNGRTLCKPCHRKYGINPRNKK